MSEIIHFPEYSYILGHREHEDRRTSLVHRVIAAESAG